MSKMKPSMSFLRGWAVKLHSFMKKLSPDEINFDEFEAEIDAQVDAVFKVAKEMESFTDAEGITEAFKLNYNGNESDIFAGYKTFAEFNEKMKVRRELQKRGRFPKLIFFVIFLVSLLIAHFIVPKSFNGARKGVGLVNETITLVSDFISLFKPETGNLTEDGVNMK